MLRLNVSSSSGLSMLNEQHVSHEFLVRLEILSSIGMGLVCHLNSPDIRNPDSRVTYDRIQKSEEEEKDNKEETHCRMLAFQVRSYPFYTVHSPNISSRLVKLYGSSRFCAAAAVKSTCCFLERLKNKK